MPQMPFLLNRELKNDEDDDALSAFVRGTLGMI